MIYIIKFQEGYGEDFNIKSGLTVEQAALFGLKKYKSLKEIDKKFGINFVPEDELDIPEEKKGTTPLLDFSLYEPKDNEDLFRIKIIFKNVLKRTIRKVNNFVPIHYCEECDYPAEFMVVFAEKHRDGMKYYFENTAYYCSGHGNMVRRLPDAHINLEKIAFDSALHFPKELQDKAYWTLRDSTGFDYKRMGDTKKDRRIYCQQIIESLPERVEMQTFLIDPREFKLDAPLPVKRRRRKTPEIQMGHVQFQLNL